MTIKSAEQTVAELAKLIRDIIDAGKLQEKSYRDNVVTLSRYGKEIQNRLTEERIAKIHVKGYIKQLETQERMMEKQNEQHKSLIQLREKEKRITERVHADQVRRNIELRHSLENTVSGLTMFKTALSGIGLVGGAGQGAFSLLGQFAANARYRQLGRDKAGWQKNMDVIRGRGLGQYLEGDELKAEWTKETLPSDKLRDDLALFNQAREERDNISSTQKNAAQFEFLRTHPTFKKLLDMSGKVQDFVVRHKTGVAISLVSLGLMIGMWKKIFEASPMMNKMFDLFKLMFDLTLRPIGDMFGFFLLPILRVVMASVLPMFARVYPKMIEFGLQLGNIFTNNGQGFSWISFLEAIGFVAEKIRPWDVLMWFFGMYTPSSADDAAGTEAQALTLGATGGGLAATAGLGYGAQKGVRSLINRGKTTGSKFGMGGIYSQIRDPTKWNKFTDKIKNTFRTGKVKGTDPMSIAHLIGIAEEGAAVVLGKEEELERMQEQRSENFWNQLLYNPDQITDRFLPQAYGETTSIGHIDMHFHGSDFAGYPIEQVGERQTEELAKKLGKRNNMRYSI